MFLFYEFIRVLYETTKILNDSKKGFCLSSISIFDTFSVHPKLDLIEFYKFKRVLIWKLFSNFLRLNKKADVEMILNFIEKRC